MDRISIINELITKFGYKNYLEIGVDSGILITKVNCENIVGVDPNPESKATIHKTSDDFFATNTMMFDICFIDGLHEHHQVYRDAINCLKFLKKGGIILFHDMMPTDELCAKVPMEVELWTGDCYHAFVQLRTERKDLEMFVIDTDWGIGFMRKGKQQLLDLKGLEINYKNFDANRKEWLNLITVAEYKHYLEHFKEPFSLGKFFSSLFSK